MAVMKTVWLALNLNTVGLALNLNTVGLEINQVINQLISVNYNIHKRIRKSAVHEKTQPESKRRIYLYKFIEKFTNWKFSIKL